MLNVLRFFHGDHVVENRRGVLSFARHEWFSENERFTAAGSRCRQNLRNRELTNQQLLLNDAAGFRDMPTAHALKGLGSVAPNLTTFVAAICQRFKTTGSDDFLRYFEYFWRSF